MCPESGLFENKPFKPSEVAGHVYGLWNDIVSSFGSEAGVGRISLGVEVICQAPPAGWVALNVDGSAQLLPPAASFGGLIRDNDGRFVRGFYDSLGNSTIMRVELCALLHGLELCWELG